MVSPGCCQCQQSQVHKERTLSKTWLRICLLCTTCIVLMGQNQGPPAPQDTQCMKWILEESVSRLGTAPMFRCKVSLDYCRDHGTQMGNAGMKQSQAQSRNQPNKLSTKYSQTG